MNDRLLYTEEMESRHERICREKEEKRRTDTARKLAIAKAALEDIVQGKDGDIAHRAVAVARTAIAKL